MLTGWKTIITNSAVFLWAVLAYFGVEVGADEKTALVAGVIALINFALRFVTKTPVGQSS